MTVPTILPGAEPFFFAGDPAKAGARIGCLCLHGLNASPQEMYWLGRSLAAHGATAYGPRLFGHGIDVSLLNRARWQDWYSAALDGYYVLRAQCDYVFVLGLSMGGLCSLLLAAEQPVDGVVALAAALRVNGEARAAHLLRYTGVTVLRFDRDKDVIDKRVKALQSHAGERLTGRVSYYAHKATGISELLRMQAVTRARLSKISAPALLVYSERDSVIPFSVMAELQGALTGSANVQALPLSQSDHILTNDVEMDQVFDACWAFIQAAVQRKATAP
jgi:carboxylesterase